MTEGGNLTHGAQSRHFAGGATATATTRGGLHSGETKTPHAHSNWKDVSFDETYHNPFKNIHPFTLSNLSESAICTSDEDDSYSYSGPNHQHRATHGGGWYHGAHDSVLDNNKLKDLDLNKDGGLEQGVATDDAEYDSTRKAEEHSYTAEGQELDEDEAADVFHPRPLTDTPVLSAVDFNLNDETGAGVEDTEDTPSGAGNSTELGSLGDPDALDLNASTTDTPLVKYPSLKSHFKEKYDRLMPKPMARIESQETAVITTTSDSNNNSGTSLTSYQPGPGSVFDIPGQTVSKSSPEGCANFAVGDKLVVVMIGLPARGKSYLSNKMVRYLNWLQIKARIFNVGSTRRSKSKNIGEAMGPGKIPLPDKNDNAKDRNAESDVTDITDEKQDASFFSPNNKKSFELREIWARETLDSLLDYLLNSDGCVGVFDATNTTVARRKMVFDRIQERSNGRLKVLYLESICNDEEIIEKNILLKLRGPDYKDMDPKVAKEDFVNRLANYKKVYQTISSEEEKNPNFQYIQMIDVGRKIISCNINGYIASQIVYYFLNFNLKERLIFVTRHGESFDNLKGRIGGDSNLTERGRKYSIALARFVEEKKNEFNSKLFKKMKMSELCSNNMDKVTVISSALKRSVQTAEPFNDSTRYDTKQLRLLNELGSGQFDGMTYSEISNLYPDEFEERIKNKLTYRYPGVGGESYLDVIGRLKPVINEIERSKNHLLIISHRVVCRILMAYFLNLKKDAIGDLDIPLHSVYMFEPKPFGVLWHLWEYDEATDSFNEIDLNKITPENLKTVKQVGISFRERKYSVVPTAPFGFNESLSRKGSFKNMIRPNESGNLRGSFGDYDRSVTTNHSRNPIRRNINDGLIFNSSVRSTFEKKRGGQTQKTGF